MESVDSILTQVGLIVEVIGVAMIITGASYATFVYIRMLAVGEASVAYRRYRSSLGKAILLGLEFLVAGDIIGTVAVEPTFQSLGVLGGIVLIRTFLSFSLEAEINGHWPWQDSKYRVQSQSKNLTEAQC